MKLALVGSRGFLDLTLVESMLRLCPRTWSSSRGSGRRGHEVEQAAAKRGMKVQVIVPNYDKHGHGRRSSATSASSTRARPWCVFWDGKSRGTSDVMMRAMRRRSCSGSSWAARRRSSRPIRARGESDGTLQSDPGWHDDRDGRPEGRDGLSAGRQQPRARRDVQDGDRRFDSVAKGSSSWSS